jgi:hypothetical protein
MTKFRNYFIIFASVFAITAACAMQDVKAQDSMSDLIKRIEALESKPAAGGNVTAGKIRGLKIGLNLRHRYENRSQDFNRTSFGSSTQAANGVRTKSNMSSGAHATRKPSQDFTLQRMRLSFDMDINKNVLARVMFQDVRTFGDSGITGNNSQTDVQEGYVQLRNLGDINSLLSNVQLRIGRWQQGYGNHRVIGTLGWANQSRSYDGAKVMYKKGNLWVDVFAWQIDETADGGVSGSGGTFGVNTDKDTVLWGFYSQYKFGGFLKGNVIEPYLVVKSESIDEDVTNSTAVAIQSRETRYTWGFRAAGKGLFGGGFDYTIEPNYQSGTSDYTPFTKSQTANAKESIDAWAIHAEAGYTFKNLPWTPRIGYAYSFASGDDGFDEGTQQTYKQVSPTQHAHNGYMDVTSWQNIIDHQLHLNVKPTKKLVVDVKAHFFELDKEHDDWYHVGGTAVNGTGADRYLDANGNSQDTDDELGQEIDVTLKYKMFENFGVVAGYSHFFAGDFIEDTAGGNDRGVDWFYLQTTVKF